MSSLSTSTPNDSSPNIFIQVSETIPSLQECSNFVSDDSCGAIATFVGTARNNFQGKTVTKLSYEAYVPMAVKQLATICQEAQTKYSDVYKIAIAHVLGDCPVGRPSVIVAVSSPHRKQAIHAMEEIVNELKARVPIWKLEVYQGDDSAVWKENLEWKEEKMERVMVKQERPIGS
jgi:molybdopterin synthase catalytic subunit